jgi:hypothetical protein
MCLVALGLTALVAGPATSFAEGIGGALLSVEPPADEGPAVIAFDGPLVLDATPEPAALTRGQLLQGVGNADAKSFTFDPNDITVTGQDGAVLDIDTATAGVYPVTYTVAYTTVVDPDADPDAKPEQGTATATRAVVVNDGRFVVDAENEALIGAQDFAVSAEDASFAGTAADVVRLSFAEAYGFKGQPLTVELAGPLSPDFSDKMPGAYEFTLKVQGLAAPTRGITGEIVAPPLPEDDPPAADAAPPALLVQTPFEVAVGSAWDEAAALVGVSAVCPNDGDITHLVTCYPTDQGRPVDTSRAGIYPVTYQVHSADSDENIVTAQRVVVVNDGRYTPGEGRVVEASSFVIPLADVPPAATRVEAHLLGMASARAFDGTTGEELPSGLLSVADANGYTKALGQYEITVSAEDDPDGAIIATVKGTVVDADVLDSAPLDPDDPTGPRIYVFGQNATMRVSEVAAILSANPLEADSLLFSSDALVDALLVGAILVDSVDGNVFESVRIVDDGGLAAEPGLYTVRMADADSLVEIVLNVQIVSGEPPTITVNGPVRIPVSEGNGDVTGLIAAAFTAEDPEDGDLSGKVVIEGSVQGSVPGIYPVTLRVIDADGNETAVNIAVVVDDGSFVFGGDYIIGATGVALEDSAVDIANKLNQAVELSQAAAAKLDGTSASVTVSDFGGYANKAGQYRLVLAVAADPSVHTAVVATVTTTAVAPPPPNRYAVTFNANGGSLTGPTRIYIQEPATTLAYLPSEPVRAGYDFLHWATEPGTGVLELAEPTLAAATQFSASTPVTSDVTVYAQWAKSADTPTAPNNPSTPNSPTTPSTPNNPPAASNTPAPATPSNPPTTRIPSYVPSPQSQDDADVAAEDEADIEIVLDEEEPAADPEDEKLAFVPIAEDIGGENPLVAEQQPPWALFNVVAVVLSGLLALVTAGGLFRDRGRKDPKYREDPIDPASWASMSAEQRVALMVRREKDRKSWLDRQERKVSKDKATYVNAPVMLVSTVAFVEGLAILLNTQNFSGPLAIADGYSIPLALLVLAQIATPVIAALLKNRGTKGGSGVSSGRAAAQS